MRRAIQYSLFSASRRKNKRANDWRADGKNVASSCWLRSGERWRPLVRKSQVGRKNGRAISDMNDDTDLETAGTCVAIAVSAVVGLYTVVVFFLGCAVGAWMQR